MTIKSPFLAFEKSEPTSRKFLTKEEIEILRDEINEFQAEVFPLEEFEDIYPQPEIENDKKAIQELERKFEKETPGSKKESKFYSSLLEMLIAGLSNSWIPGSFTKSSKFDDYKRSTDLFLEVQDKDQNLLRLALDVTSDERGIKNKLDEAFSEFEKGQFHKVKYFKSDIDGSKGELLLPRLIVGTARLEIIDLAKLYILEKNAQGAEAKKPYRRRIANHHFGEQLQQMILLQITKALEAFRSSGLLERSSTWEKINYLEGLKTIFEEHQKEKTREESRAEVANQNRIQIAIGEALEKLTFPKSDK